MEYYQIKHKISFVKIDCPGSDNSTLIRIPCSQVNIKKRILADDFLVNRSAKIVFLHL